LARPAAIICCVIFSDGKNQASMISGIRGGRAEKRIFRHNDVNHLEFLLRQIAPDRSKLIVTIYCSQSSVRPCQREPSD
jgi:5-aminolevulinate synthase